MGIASDNHDGYGHVIHTQFIEVLYSPSIYDLHSLTIKLRLLPSSVDFTPVFNGRSENLCQKGSFSTSRYTMNNEWLINK